MESISAFFRGVFGFARTRRSADGSTEEGSPRFILTIWKPLGGQQGESEQQPEQPAPGAVQATGGRESFMNLIDQMCRVYCDMCPGPNQSRDFKIAAKELLQFLFKEDNKKGLDLAAENYLNNEFMQSLMECKWAATRMNRWHGWQRTNLPQYS